MAKSKSKDIALPEGLPPEQLRTACDPTSFGFVTTAELKPSGTIIGQDRAIDAINLSASLVHRDFNIYVLGREGMGRHEIVAKLIRQQAAKRPSPSDWVYVNNFDAPHKPHAIRLPPSRAPMLKTAMQEVVDDLANDIPALFESEEYQTQRRAIEEEFSERHEEPIAEFAERARQEQVALLRTPMGFMLAAIVDGKPIKPEVYEALPPNEREAIDEKIERLQEHLASVLQLGPQLEKEHRRNIEALHAELAERAVSLRIQEVLDAFCDCKEVCQHIERVRQDMVSNPELFLMSKQRETDSPFPVAIRKYHLDSHFDRYAINIMVSQANVQTAAAPVVCEDLPTLPQLTGRIEYVSEMGTLATNFTLIKPGALHKANGGYLVLEARRLLSEPYAWEALKRCLQAGTVTITSLSERLSLSSTVSLEPEPIPLDVRIVMIGDRRLHMLLQMLDPEFDQIFKLQADFEDDLPRTGQSMKQMANLLAGYAQKQDLNPLTAAAVASLVEHAARLADDSTKLTLQLNTLHDIMHEADHYAASAGRETVSEKEVSRAIEQADRRASRIKDRLQEAVSRKTILIETSGTAVGQINGLSVIGISHHRFGRPSRITARVRMGAGKLIDIEREVELGGPLHSKGVLILGGYLAARYAQDVPMSLHATLVFEQSYGGVDGDSASSAELYALLSALSGVPIRQGFAVTGSVNQNGEVQAIGGVNEKIEGFFDTCKARRLTGQQGVLIPAANVEHLMLRPDVVQAVSKGKFRIIPVRTIDEGIEVLTGHPAGKPSRAGRFPNGSLNAMVDGRLRDFAETRRRFGSGSGAAKPLEDRK
jgi:lon-related putative ATP-dependent protease